MWRKRAEERGEGVSDLEATGILTQEEKTGGTALVDTWNGFNDLG